MSGKHILVIDDDRAVRDAFELALGDEGHTVRLAEDGLNGVDMARQQRPDLVFLDLKMPGMDGVETLRRLLAHDPSIKVYIVTAFAQEYMSGLAQAKQDGLRFQLAAKPLSPQQIRLVAQAALATS
ncbi:MAG TPA: response regulator [Noviherbaspirillum sp.]|nr:response regulator [Noviherbaspirillum sp.]